MERDTDWPMTPWFLDLAASNTAFEELGYSHPLREAAARQLGRLFAAELCSPPAGASDPLVASLRHPCRPDAVGPLLDVGLDLEVGGAWDDEHLIARLRRHAEFEDAALELRVFANAFRAGYRPRRIPRGPGKTADFVVTIGHTEEYEVEVKGRGEVELARLGDELNQRLASADIAVPGLHLELQGSASLYETAVKDREAFLGMGDGIVGAFAGAVEQLRANGALPGTYEVPPFGRIMAVPGGQSATPDILADVPTGVRAEQALRLVRTANKQLKSRKGIVIIDVRRRADLGAVGRVVQRAAGELGRVRMVVVADTLPADQVPGQSRPVVLPVAVPANRELPKALQAFASAVMGRRGAGAQVLSESSSTGHSRRGVTAVTLSEHYRQADGTFRVSVNDLRPGVFGKR